ncbi:FAD-dependent monooxygenase [Micromonospora endolithica]|uniref:FAD-binding monooxygenase n=1 Tax=Micromonospora endolithica TaxID=230091 RepID=A0A3A9ZNM7_9ACTN|nr:FAD-dependent monooxygenase [Micromonospora endolithica]RKN49534.1 FAD-binding monooxygenase [Micromonospora endolithica]TWJ23749.1 2-polyprenyl-6-methoxyphenol hydroxylase-like FAD-dependent oxidoreductase [Micromonospora endolithica]
MGGSPLRILVVGAGIAGLAVARALRLAGFRPDVTEKAPPGELSDTGLYLPGNAARALRRLDLDGPVRPLGEIIRRQRFLDATGAPLCEVDLESLWAGVGECRALLRAELHRVLLTGAGGAVRHGAEVRTIDLLPGAVGVTFVDGTATEYDLVVGADGPRSSVRGLAALGGPSRPTGQIVYRSVVREGPRVAEWTALLGQRAGFLVVPVGAGRLHCYADETGTAPPDDPVARLRELFGDYGGPVPEVLDALEQVHVGATDEVELGRWHRGRVLLVGDAAHATAPTLSQGAAMALEDAVVLAESLKAAGSVDAALTAYESRRRPRTRWVRDRTRDRNRTRDVPPALRDPLLRGRGGRIFGEHYRLLLGPL